MVQVSAFYKANLVTMDLEKVARSAPKRSPSPDCYDESWEETPVSGSGAITPSISNTSTPADVYPGLNYSAYPFDSHFRQNGSSSSAYGTYGTMYSQTSNMAPSSDNHTRFYSTTPESMRVQYGASVDSRSRGSVSTQFRAGEYASSPYIESRTGGEGRTPVLGLSSRPISVGQISYQPPILAPTTLRTAFRSTFPYSNLSPANFAVRDSGVHGTTERNTRPSSRQSETSRHTELSTDTSTASMAFDTVPPFVYHPQAWAHAPLQTTEDLVAYLEHRTKLAGQQ